VSGLVASLGKFNFLMSDGEHLIAYGHDRLHYLEHDPAQRDGHCVLIATEPLNRNADWTCFQTGELRLYRAGKITGRIVTQTMRP
jgi:glutamine amidotransferase